MTPDRPEVLADLLLESPAACSPASMRRPPAPPRADRLLEQLPHLLLGKEIEALSRCKIPRISPLASARPAVLPSPCSGEGQLGQALAPALEKRAKLDPQQSRTLVNILYPLIVAGQSASRIGETTTTHSSH